MKKNNESRNIPKRIESDIPQKLNGHIENGVEKKQHQKERKMILAIKMINTILLVLFAIVIQPVVSLAIYTKKYYLIILYTRMHSPN